MRHRSPSSDSSAVAFFRRHAGYSRAPGESIAEAKQNTAERLAHAEAEGRQRGWHVNWEEDPDPYQMGDLETVYPREVLGAVLLNDRGLVLSSLWGIGDPSHSYRRVVEAELMLEALDEDEE